MERLHRLETRTLNEEQIGKAAWNMRTRAVKTEA